MGPRRLLVAALLVAHSTEGYDGWANLQGANYVPTYSHHDVWDIFTARSWNATVVDRELGYAKNLAVTSLRVFATYAAWEAGDKAFIDNYKTFQNLMKAHELTLMTTFLNPYDQCENATDFINAVVAAEVPGVVIAYESDNEPAPWALDYVKNCTLPAVLNASRNPGVDVSVGLAHMGEVSSVADQVTTLNWHSYTGAKNGGGLQGEIDTLQKIANKYTPPKPLVLTEWLARPAQPLAAAYPVIRDNKVAAYNWALVFVDCTTKWQIPVAPGDPPFQGMLYANGSAYDDLEEGECMRTQCRALTYAHHCCNMVQAQDDLFNFSGSDWQQVNFGNPVYKRAGPRESSARQTASAGASVTIGPLPGGTKRVALYLPTSPLGAGYTIQLGGTQIHKGTTNGTLDWVARVVLPVASSGGSLELTVDRAAPAATKFNVTGVTFFST